jgi:HNH endonuclease
VRKRDAEDSEWERLERDARRAAVRLGHGGQGTPHGWTPLGRRLLALAAAGRTRNCLACHRPITPTETGRNAGKRPAYHRGCSDAFYDLHYRAWHITKRVVWARDGGRCRMCGTSGPDPWPLDSDFRWEYDHIVEIARGGDPLDPANVQLVCSPCHRRKTSSFLSRPRYVIAPTQARLEEAA